MAEAGKALEINTVLPLHPTVVRWWHEVGGDAVSFGSDAHEPASLARRFREASDLAEACGFRAGSRPARPLAARRLRPGADVPAVELSG